ncbi:MAG TPA: glycine cleavage T C-terminal barrel domain-containing protein, partial [Armatimonadota bacterium]|nr:glycine cleavage T C-terminal barrel domain-containing protein [Armatimonadota bacterium]
MGILDKHLVMEDVEIAEMHGAWGMLSLQGPSALSALQSMVGPGVALTGASEVIEWSAGGEPVYLLGISHTGEHGFDLLAPREALPDLWTQLTGSVREHGGGPVGLDALNALRIEAGIPWWGDDLDHSLLMLEAGMDDAIHYQKGCYLGQETLARIHFRGRTNRQLMGLTLSEAGGLPPRSARLHAEDREAGWVTSAVQSPTLGRPIALGFVRREFLAPGTRLKLEDGGEAVVTALPFVTGH